jgi:outer membrane lipase/esterase
MRLRDLVIAVALLFIAGAAQASPYTGLVVFGDSLVDSGNAHLGALQLGLPDPTPASLGYFDGRFSNGPNFADYLSQAIAGVPATPLLAGGRNAAVGGAQAASNADASPDFLQQIDLFAGAGKTIQKSDLVLVTLGGNDVRDVLDTPGPVDFNASVAAMQTGLSELIAGGARNIVVVGLPDIGLLPDTAAEALSQGNPTIIPLATARSIALNRQFNAVAHAESAASGSTVRFFNLFKFEDQLLSDPAAFGFPSLDSVHPCLAGGAPAVLDGCQGYLYFDAIHPTTQVHQAIAEAIGASIPEPSSWYFVVSGVGAIGAALRRRTFALSANT